MGKIVKVCVYTYGNGVYFPVVFMAQEAETGTHSRLIKQANGHPNTNGCRIVPMGKSPFNGVIENMTLTAFEDILNRYGCRFVCVIPSYLFKTCADCYSAFRWMMLGRNLLR